MEQQYRAILLEDRAFVKKSVFEESILEAKRKGKERKVDTW